MMITCCYCNQPTSTRRRLSQQCIVCNLVVWSCCLALRLPRCNGNGDRHQLVPIKVARLVDNPQGRRDYASRQRRRAILAQPLQRPHNATHLLINNPLTTGK